MISRITSSLRQVFVWSCALLALGAAVLWVRSYWRCDEAVYYSYKPAPPPSNGRDCRNLIGSWRGGILWLNTETEIKASYSYNPVSWYGGEPTEILLESSPSPRLAMAALGTTGQQGVQLVPPWPKGGFDFKADSGQRAWDPFFRGMKPWQWRYRCLIVPHAVPLLLLAWIPAMRLRRHWTQYRWHRKGLCVDCGYDIRASGAVCSECGRSLLRPESASFSPSRQHVRRYAGIAVVGLFVVGVILLWSHMHPRTNPAEPVVRLNPATALREGQLPQRVELDVAPGVYMQFALIPSGRFLMGSPPDEVGRHEDERQREVSISRQFYLGTKEVTQEQFQTVMGTNPAVYFKGLKHPVESVTSIEAIAFCRRVSERSGRKLRLPTEAEWEYACRAGTTTPFHTGPKLTRDMAAYAVQKTYPSYRRGDPERCSVPVGSFRPNAWGLHDMHGSVYEWCNVAGSDHPVSERQAIEERFRGILRGGCASDGPAQCRAAWRYDPQGGPFLQAGFRVCLDF